MGRTLSHAYSDKNVFDLTSLLILSGRHCWILYIDILVRNAFFYDWRLRGCLKKQVRLSFEQTCKKPTNIKLLHFLMGNNFPIFLNLPFLDTKIGERSENKNYYSDSWMWRKSFWRCLNGRQGCSLLHPHPQGVGYKCRWWGTRAWGNVVLLFQTCHSWKCLVTKFRNVTLATLTINWKLQTNKWDSDRKSNIFVYVVILLDIIWLSVFYSFS